jgi:hypothetical protein
MINRYQGRYATSDTKKRERDSVSPDLTSDSPARATPDQDSSDENKREYDQLEDCDAVFLVQFTHCGSKGRGCGKVKTEGMKSPGTKLRTLCEGKEKGGIG